MHIIPYTFQARSSWKNKFFWNSFPSICSRIYTTFPSEKEGTENYSQLATRRDGLNLMRRVRTDSNSYFSSFFPFFPPPPLQRGFFGMGHYQSCDLQSSKGSLFCFWVYYAYSTVPHTLLELILDTYAWQRVHVDTDSYIQYTVRFWAAQKISPSPPNIYRRSLSAELSTVNS